jgi:uncharacterized lipoprotein YddW (UPF0748 family)
MKRYPAIATCYLMLLLSALLPAQRTAAPSQISDLPPAQSVARPSPSPVSHSETRALWVVRSTLSSPGAVIDLVRRARENGFTDLVVQVRGRGDAYYDSHVEPRAEALLNQPVEFDPLSMTIKEAHGVGIRVHAWINIFLVAGIETLPTSREHLIHKHPEWMMVPRGLAPELYHLDPHSPQYLPRIVDYVRANRAKIEGLFVSPAHREVNENIFNIWMDVAQNYDVDGLHFDYVRYPNQQFDYSRASLDRFRAELDKGLETQDREFLESHSATDPLIYATTFHKRYEQFQRDQVTELVRRIYEGVKKVKPRALISAAVFANEAEAAQSRYQDWKLWVQRGWLDAICPMAYTSDTATFRNLILGALKNSAGKQVWGGIGAFRQPAESAIEKVQVTREVGAQGFILFSYDSSIKVSATNPQGDYLERMRESLNASFKVEAR